MLHTYTINRYWCLSKHATLNLWRFNVLNPRVKVSIAGSLRDREVACSASDRQGSNFESCVWRTVSSQSSHHPQEVLLAQFSLYVHKGGLKPDSFHFISMFWLQILCLVFTLIPCAMGGNPGTMVKAACLENRRSRVRTPLWNFGVRTPPWHLSFKETIHYLPRSLEKIQY